MHIIIFEDHATTKLYPATIGKPAFAISCAGYRLIDLLRRMDATIEALVRPHLRALVHEDYPDLRPNNGRRAETVLLVNARLVPRAGLLDTLGRLLEQRQPVVVQADGTIAAAVLSPDNLLPETLTGSSQLIGTIHDMHLHSLDMDMTLFGYPHDIVRHHLGHFMENMEDRLARGDYREIQDDVFAAEGATLGPYVVTDCSAGPIVLERNATIGPYCYMAGPAVIGANARVIEHAAIKDCVALGHTTKVGGEVEGSIIEPFTNKQHHGFLGHSYLGSWVNLGAGTCNSDLKNTYGNVTMEYGGQRVRTGMQFVGCIMGDYAKTAINTSVFTGKTVGACSMVYGFVTTNVPSFVNYARSFGQATEAPVDVMISTQKRMFERRNVQQRSCDQQLLRDMYELTRHERQLANEPLSL